MRRNNECVIEMTGCEILLSKHGRLLTYYIIGSVLTESIHLVVLRRFQFEVEVTTSCRIGNGYLYRWIDFCGILTKQVLRTRDTTK